MPEQLVSPDPKLVRQRIEQTEDGGLRIFLKALYLFAGRASELCGVKYTTDKIKEVYGPHGNDCHKEQWQDETYANIRAEVIVFTIRTAKRGGFIRNIGLPVEYESWAKELYDHYQKHGKELVFPFTRHHAKYMVKKEGMFKGIEYPISKYRIVGDPKPVEGHMRGLVLHGLRHVRAIELMERFHFNLEQVAIYGGWTLRSMGGQLVTPVLVDHYLSLGYRFYIGKLLRT